MLVSRIDRLLARTDPFDLAQAVERYVGTLPGDRIIALLLDAQVRLGAHYRAEFLRFLDPAADDFAATLAQPWSDRVLQSAFTRFLQSNLRAIPIFGTAFGMAVLERAPVERAIAIGEERSSPATRAAVIAGSALALILAGAAGEHVIAGARSAAQTPEPVAAMMQPIYTPPPAAPAKKRVAATASPSPTPAPKPAPATIPPPPTPLPATAVPSPARASAPPRAKSSNAPVIVVTAPPQTPTPQPSDLDVSDMPESYSDATPLPEQTAAPAQTAQRSVKLVTPTPAPKHHSWLHRAVMHLDPFKPHPQPT